MHQWLVAKINSNKEASVVATLEGWGVTDYLKSPWTDGAHSAKTELGFKLDEMSQFADAYLPAS